MVALLPFPPILPTCYALVPLWTKRSKPHRFPSSLKPARRCFPPSPCPRSTAGFCLWMSPRSAPNSSGGARACASCSRIAERLAMEEVKRGLVMYDVPPVKGAAGTEGA